MAHEIGKHLHEVMGWPGPMTHRQYIGWQSWLRRQWSEPNRSDHYAMQVAAEVRRVAASFSDKPPEIKIEDFKLAWGESVATPDKTEQKPKTNPDAWKHRQAIVMGILSIDTPAKD